MSQNRNEELNELDRELARMAQDVPEMPADFHARWTEQIRQEAAGSRQEKAAPRKESRRQWRYVLSAAALFVFLIGGTLLTRSTGNRNALDSAALSNSIVPQETEELRTEGAEDADGAPAPALFAMNFAANGPAEEPEEAEYAAEEAAGAAVYSNAAATAMPTAMPAQMPALQAGKGVSADAAVPEAEEAAEEPADAGVPEEPEEAAESGFVSFLKDLGIFTLKTLAVLLCGAVLAFTAALIRRKMKERKK